VISKDKDLTFKPTIFDNRIYMFQNEYRQENENSSFIADFNYVKGYQSALEGNDYSNRNSISHLFAKLNIDLGFNDFINSKLKFFLEKVNNDTYLKVFENVLLVDEKFKDDLMDKSNLTSGAQLLLDNEDYNFTTGFDIYENLSVINSDRYQYVFPYYDFNTTLFSDLNGSLNFGTSGRSSLSNTNNLRTNISNTINYTTNDLYSKSGFVNNFGIYFKNLNITGKNDTKYKSSIQSELLNIYELNSVFPLIKSRDNSMNYITPKISFRINPSDMKNNSSESRLITTDNIFDIDRLGLASSYESGKSITLGVDFKKEDISDVEKYLEIKLASILRDTKEDKIPTTSTANRTTSNLFGSIENSFSDTFKLNYDFSIDNDFNKFEHNSIEAEFNVNNFVTKFNFLEKNGEVGDVNTLENTSKISFDNNNSLVFKTRRNRKISLTEYYDLVYEYQNDCITAGIKYRKTYYEDRDLKPKEDLFFTITLFPLTSLDQKIDQSLYRND
jgi:LPS-assembly protein